MVNSIELKFESGILRNQIYLIQTVYYYTLLPEYCDL
jgi:hypothetical protein